MSIQRVKFVLWKMREKAAAKSTIQWRKRERDSPTGLISIGDGSRYEWGQGWYKRGTVTSVEHQSSNPRNSSNHEGIHGESNLSRLFVGHFRSTSSFCYRPPSTFWTVSICWLSPIPFPLFLHSFISCFLYSFVSPFPSFLSLEIPHRAYMEGWESYQYQLNYCYFIPRFTT